MKTLPSFFRRWLPLLAILGGIASCPALPWVERHNVSAATFESEYDTWTAAPYHLRLTRLCGSESGGAARYTAIFEKSGKTSAIRERHGLNSIAFSLYHSQVHALGYRLVWLDGFGVGSTAYYNGIWEYQGTHAALQRVRLGETLANHQTAGATNTADGYLLTDVSSFSVDGAAQHAGVWTSGGGGDMQFRYSLTGAGYQTQFETLGSQGYQIWRVSGYETGGNERFSAVWRRTSLGSGWTYHGMSASHFESHHANAQYVGYRPVAIEPYNIGSETRYNAYWARNGGLTATRLGNISAYVEDYMSDHNLPGLSLAIAWQGRLVYSRGFGYADTSTGELADHFNRWRIASVSKPVCAVAALHALQESAPWSLGSTAFGPGGLFGSDYGDTATYPYSASEKAITLRQLLNMTAGWSDQGRLW